MTPTDAIDAGPRPSMPVRPPGESPVMRHVEQRLSHPDKPQSAFEKRFQDRAKGKGVMFAAATNILDEGRGRVETRLNLATRYQDIQTLRSQASALPTGSAERNTLERDIRTLEDNYQRDYTTVESLALATAAGSDGVLTVTLTRQKIAGLGTLRSYLSNEQARQPQDSNISRALNGQIEQIDKIMGELDKLIQTDTVVRGRIKRFRNAGIFGWANDRVLHRSSHSLVTAEILDRQHNPSQAAQYLNTLLRADRERIYEQDNRNQTSARPAEATTVTDETIETTTPNQIPPELRTNLEQILATSGVEQEQIEQLLGTAEKKATPEQTQRLEQLAKAKKTAKTIGSIMGILSAIFGVAVLRGTSNN